MFTALSAASTSAAAQSSDNATRGEVLRVVDRFFLAMTRRDSAEARRVLVAHGGFYTVRAAGGDSVPPRRTNADFVAMLSKPGPLLKERIWNPTVHIDGAVAQVWAPYDFHVDGKFSHCGTDAFSLIRANDGWKIAEIVYTVQQTGCAPSPLGAIK
jgi:hypothetical protein